MQARRAWRDTEQALTSECPEPPIIVVSGILSEKNAEQMLVK